MSEYSKNRETRINPETSEVEVETFFRVDSTTIEENRKLYTEDDVKYYRETYGGFMFDKKLHKFGAYTYSCGSIFLAEEESKVTERVFHTDGKKEQREHKRQDKYNAEVVSLEGLSYTDDEGYLDCNVPYPRDQLEEILENDRTIAIIKALRKSKERYVQIFILMLKYNYGPTKIAELLGMKKQTVSDDMKVIRRIAAEIYLASEDI